MRSIGGVVNRIGRVNVLRGEPDPHRVVEKLNTMRLDGVSQPGSAPPRLRHGEAGLSAVPVSSWSHQGMELDTRLVCFLPEELRSRALANRGYVIFTPSPGLLPIIDIDPGSGTARSPALFAPGVS